jgi:hypothetical protein
MHKVYQAKLEEAELMPILRHWSTNRSAHVRSAVASFLCVSNYQSEASFLLRIALASDSDERGTAFNALNALSFSGAKGHRYLELFLTNDAPFRRHWASTLLVTSGRVSEEAVRLTMLQVARDGTLLPWQASLIAAGGTNSASAVDGLLALRGGGDGKIAKTLSQLGAPVLSNAVNRLPRLDPVAQFRLLCAIEEMPSIPEALRTTLQKHRLQVPELEELRGRLLTRDRAPDDAEGDRMPAEPAVPYVPPN